MPVLIIRILNMFLGSLVAKVFLGAGLAFVTYDFINALVIDSQDYIAVLFGALPADIMGLMGILKIPQAISVVMSGVGLAAFIKTSKIAIGRR